MFALLGEVQFEIIGSPESIESSRRYDYAVHRVIQDRPTLQWLAPDLERLQFELLLHRSFTNPAADLAGLLAAAETHQVLPLVFGTGEYRGSFVISELDTLFRQLSGNGAPIAIAVRIELLESPLDPGTAPVSDLLPIAAAALPALANSRWSAAVGRSSGVSSLTAIAASSATPAIGVIPADVPPAFIVRKVG